MLIHLLYIHSYIYIHNCLHTYTYITHQIFLCSTYTPRRSPLPTPPVLHILYTSCYATVGRRASRISLFATYSRRRQQQCFMQYTSIRIIEMFSTFNSKKKKQQKNRTVKLQTKSHKRAFNFLHKNCIFLCYSQKVASQCLAFSMSKPMMRVKCVCVCVCWLLNCAVDVSKFKYNKFFSYSEMIVTQAIVILQLYMYVLEFLYTNVHSKYV